MSEFESTVLFCLSFLAAYASITFSSRTNKNKALRQFYTLSSSYNTYFLSRSAVTSFAK